MRITRRWLLLGTGLALGACGGAIGRPAERFPGRVTVERSAGGALFSAPARGTFCDRDGIVALAAVSDAWGMALSARASWPTAVAGRYPVRPPADSSGRALLALRPLATNEPAAWLAVDGTVRFAASRDSLAGNFDATLVRPEADTLVVRGEFSVPAPGRACP